MMHIDPKKTLLAGLFLALTVATSGGYAGDERGRGFWKPFEPSVDGQENIVISLSTDPTTDEGAEAACVALQIGINLLMDNLSGTAVTPADRVVLFVTLDGVELVAPGSDDSESVLSQQTCLTPTPNVRPPLSAILSQFVDEWDGEVVVCPLCWSAREYSGQLPTYGSVAKALDIHSLFLYADKVIPF